jgi:sugar phosphate isomerase/epimerase
MTLDAADLVLCAGTLAFDTRLEARIEAAAAGGFQGLSLWVRDVERARSDGVSDADIRAMFAYHGIDVAELDPVWSWLPGTDTDIPESEDAFGVLKPRIDDFLRLSEAIGGRSLNACDIMGGEWTIDDAAEAFAALCDRAADHGLLVHLEFLPWSRIGDVATAHSVVRSADRPNGGVMFDSWHFFRGVPDLDALRAVPGEHLTGIQLSDAPRQQARQTEPELMKESMDARLLPGEGDCGLAQVSAILDEIGAVAPRGAEVFSSALRELDPAEVGRRVGEAMRSLLRRA